MIYAKFGLFWGKKGLYIANCFLQHRLRGADENVKTTMADHGREENQHSFDDRGNDHLGFIFTFILPIIAGFF